MFEKRLVALAAAATLAACASQPKPVPLPAADTPMSIAPDASGSSYRVMAPDGVTQVGTVASLPPPPPPPPTTTPEGFPVLVKPGECYARVVSPPRFETRTETVLAKAATERIEVVPPQYETVEEKVLVKPAGKKIIEVVPPVYKTVEETVMVKPAAERFEEVPAVFKTVEETQLIKPATTVWKKGRGPIEKVDGLTGEIMCLVTEPAEYRTLKKRVVETPATTRRIPIPAEYGTFQRQVLLKPAEVKEIETPAEYKTIRTLKLKTPAQEQRIPIPAEYQKVSSQVLVDAGRAEWKSILCETNTTPGVVQDIQRALKAKGFDPGPIDGVIGVKTSAAITGFQRANGLATGGLTMDTLARLGVSTAKR